MTDPDGRMSRLYERFVPHRWQWPWRRFQCGQPNPHDHGMDKGNPCLRRSGHKRRHRDMWSERWEQR